MADVFISYKREDRPMVERLAGALRQLGFEVWWDFELLSGEDYRAALRAVIDQCRAAVVVWSKAAAASSFVLDEASYALRQGRLCPVRIDAVEVPFGFGQSHIDDLSGWGGELSHPGFQALVKALEGRVGRKARLGADAATAEHQAAAAELEAFKAAQLAANVGALRSFVANFPGGAFVPFVRDQIESLEREDRSRSRAGAGTNTLSSSQDAVGPAGRPRWLWISVVAVVAAAVGAVGYLYQRAERQARSEVEAARTRAEQERAAAQQRASELQAQAEAERTARERAERSNEVLQRKAEQERQVRDEAARREAERQRKDAAFSLDVLHPDLRGAVVAARRNALEADGAAIRARAAAGLAEAAAERARAGRPGIVSVTFDGGERLGEGSGRSLDGYGVYFHRVPSKFAGDRFAGQFKDGARSGLGVYWFAENAGNPGKRLRREGEYAANGANGVSVLLWVSGDRHAGQWKDGIAFGPGVRTYADGRRFEGDFAADQRNGPGVLWSPEGRVISAGIWKNGRLDTPLTR